MHTSLCFYRDAGVHLVVWRAGGPALPLRAPVLPTRPHRGDGQPDEIAWPEVEDKGEWGKDVQGNIMSGEW